ncbi:NAD(P)/FAD-dependent oxidoreductase [Bryobacter aggregatus]|uniref:NAD(P)/FAD-dependent oxidoreductase n=1 Tax=Bryobacter aggregatus TaxID=360054 RepID=UPI0004E2445F|nr:FAD/NAD(P)-binding oxidoreductase [Bryobacter aggregatus]
MKVDTLIIGAGPAGLAAARGARSAGRSALVLDDNWSPGGQIWRGQASAIEGVEFRLQHPVSDIASLPIDYKRLILATGAREMFLPFPGWTLPHVVGAGGLQALSKAGLNVANKRVIVAGSGPLLLAVAANLKKAGAKILLVAEQTPWAKWFRFCTGIATTPRRWAQAARLSTLSFRAGLWPVEAVPSGVKMSDGRLWGCDYLACGFGLIPNLELPRLIGCEIQGGFVKVDQFQCTSIPNVYAVGELTGIGGVEKAEAEGFAAGSETRLQISHEGIVNLLADCFPLRPELRAITTPGTIVCRCEDVKMCKLQALAALRNAKLKTRCAMGACQGRMCGPALQFLLGWQEDRVRPPVLPLKVKDLCSRT